MKGKPRRKSALLPPELLAQTKQAFKEVFGRTQRQGDRMLLAGYRYSETDLKREQRLAFEAAASPKHLVFATEKTGRFVTEWNRALLSDDEQKEWDEAIEEYLLAEAEGLDLLEKPDTEISRAITRLKKCIENAVIHLASYADRAPRIVSRDLPAFSQHLLVVKSYWHLKCIIDKWETLSIIEISAISRSLYECTLLFAMISKNPDYASVLEAQAFGGRPPFPFRTKRDGSTDFSTIVSADGQRFPARTSFRQCATICGESHLQFFDVIYPMLSDQVHFDFRQMIDSYLSSGSFLMWDDGDETITSFLSAITATYLFSALLFAPSLQKLIKRDVGFMGRQIADALDCLREALHSQRLHNEQFEALLSSLERLEW